MAAVTMLHPASDRVQRASRDAFERVWQHEGWVLLASDEPGTESSRPGPRDPKPAWVEWAVANGADRDEAESMSKKGLIGAYGE